MVPNLIAYDIASVQAIDNRIAMVNFIKYNYGTTKGATKAGTTFADIRNLYKSDVDYTSDHVEGEEILAGDTEGTSKSFTLDWAPLLPGKVEFTLKIEAKDYQFKDDGNGAITAVTAGAPFTSGKVNYGTGAVELTLNAAKTVTAGTASYGYANEYVPAQSLPSITLSIESLPIKAKTRRLAALWGFEASYELQKEYGQSMEELLSTTASGEIAHEIDMEIMGDIYNSAVASGITFSTTAPQAISLQDHYDSFLIKLNQAANKIYQNTRRIRPNYVICGTGVATIIESIRIFKASGETSAKGPYFAGTVGQYKVYVSPDLGEFDWCLGYKGDSLLDAGFIYAPYMPIMTSGMVQLEDMAGRKGWATMYGKRLVNDKMYIKGTITNA